MLKNLKVFLLNVDRKDNMLRGTDGQPYRTAGKNQLYNPNSNLHKLFNIWDEAAIQQGGSPIYYYEMYLPLGEIDKVHGEARGKIYSPNPIELWANYEPIASQNYISEYGLISNNDVIFELNVKAALQKVGHMPKIGSRIYTPHLGENWRVIQRNLGEFKMWGALRLLLICTTWQGSVTEPVKLTTPPVSNTYKIL